MNETLRKFGWPATLVTEFEHWVVLARPAQPTLGSLVLAAKSEVTAFGDLPAAAHAELAKATAAIERALGKAVSYSKLNYLMRMMVDPHVHFHVIPRYDGARTASRNKAEPSPRKARNPMDSALLSAAVSVLPIRDRRPSVSRVTFMSSLS